MSAAKRLVVVQALALLALPSAHAQTIHKCTGTGGTVFQSTPCAPDQQQARSYGGEAYAITPQRQLEIEREQSRARARVQRGPARRGAGGTGTRSSGSRATSCEQVKAQRDQAMRRLGNRRTYEQISFWATEVSRACNHRR